MKLAHCRECSGKRHILCPIGAGQYCVSRCSRDGFMLGLFYMWTFRHTHVLLSRTKHVIPVQCVSCRILGWGPARQPFTKESRVVTGTQRG